MNVDVALGTARAMIPIEAFLGLRALNVQTYTESNIKLGAQWEYSAYNAALAAGATQRIIFKTGSKKVSVKARNIAFTGALVTARVYKNPSRSGTWNSVPFFNLRTDGLAQVSTVQILSGGVINNVGTEIGAPSYYIGGTAQGNSVVSTFSNIGNERILEENSEYVLELTNGDAGTIKLATYLSWYEGVLDLPRLTD